MNFSISYPDKRLVAAQTLRGWLLDAISNDEIDADPLEEPGMTDQEVADLLDHEGFITLVKP